MQIDPRYWLIVASRDHVLAGKKENIAQASHGSSMPLEKMEVGDWLTYYSPKEKYDGLKPCQRFTAIARITGREVFRTSLSETFKPYRRKVDFLDNIREIEIRPLISELDFIRNKDKWGIAFRKGFREIGKKDFMLICKNMRGK